MSPLAMSGILIACLTAAIVSYSASPVYRQARVRPCIANACTPISSAIFAIAMALRLFLSQPVRIFKVIGTSTALTTARNICATSGSSFSKADPAITLQIFLAGQPMLISIICAPLSTLYLAASAIILGSDPAI